MGAGGNDLLIADYSAATEAITFSVHNADISDPAAVRDYSSLGNTGAKYGTVGKLAFTGVERFTVKTGSGTDPASTATARRTACASPS